MHPRKVTSMTWLTVLVAAVDRLRQAQHGLEEQQLLASELRAQIEASHAVCHVVLLLLLLWGLVNVKAEQDCEPAQVLEAL